MTMNTWTTSEILELFNAPLLELIFRSASLHRLHHKSQEIQLNYLISIKTGNCPEDCAYCPQSARYKTQVRSHKLMELSQVLVEAKMAKAKGASRICLGAAWREVKDNQDFERVLVMVEQIAKLGLEVCCTLGFLSEGQAQRLAAAGLTAYNHNIDTSPDFYSSIISTRQFSQRIQTLSHAASASISTCCGGIIGMGESHEDRANFLYTLSRLSSPPDSIPINALVAVEGTPLANRARISPWELIRMVAVTRLVFPKAQVRLSAGRDQLSDAEQALCYLAGANSIFYGDKLLTTANPQPSSDQNLLRILGLYPKTLPSISARADP